MTGHVLEVSTDVFRLLRRRALLYVSCSDERDAPTQRIVVDDDVYTEIIDRAIAKRKTIDEIFLEICRRSRRAHRRFRRWRLYKRHRNQSRGCKNHPMNTSFDSVMPSCAVNDMPKAIRFYLDSLGFTCVFTDGDPISFVIMRRDTVEISLHTQRLGEVPGKHTCYVKVRGVDSLYSEYQSKGVKIVHALRDEEHGMREFMIADPDGNLINFGERTERSR
jgi:catechol 2,3-dioxygenase-like lactoylglutathione lyase family enzyme